MTRVGWGIVGALVGYAVGIVAVAGYGALLERRDKRRFGQAIRPVMKPAYNLVRINPEEAIGVSR